MDNGQVVFEYVRNEAAISQYKWICLLPFLCSKMLGDFYDSNKNDGIYHSGIHKSLDFFWTLEIEGNIISREIFLNDLKLFLKNKHFPSRFIPIKYN